MSRLLVLALLVASLAACSEAGPFGYGYAVNERPSLAQLGLRNGDADNSFGAATQTALADATSAH
jgi:hypothetical protein